MPTGGMPMTEVSTSSSTDRTAPYRLSALEVAQRQGLDPARGLTGAEAARRLELFGPNRLAEVTPRPKWKRFVDQFRNVLIVILIIAAVVALVVSGDVK